MHFFTFVFIALCKYSIVGERRIKRVDVDIKIKEGTDEVEVSKGETGNVIAYSIKPKIDCGFRKISDDKRLFYLSRDGDNFEAAEVLYLKGIKGPILVRLNFKSTKVRGEFRYTYYLRFLDEWRMVTNHIYNFTVNKLFKCKPDSQGKLIPPNLIVLDVNERGSNDKYEVECIKEGDNKWNIKFIPKSGCHILIITAGKGSIWFLGGNHKVPDEVNVSIADEVVVSLTFKDPKGEKEPETVIYRPHPGLKSDRDMLYVDDEDDKKKVGTIGEDERRDEEEEEDEQGVIEDPTEWTDGIDVTEEEMEKLAELQEEKLQDERVDKEVIEPEADLGEAEGELIEEGTTPSGEDIEHEVEIEEMEEEEEILPDYHLDDYFKDLKPITLDIYNHKTEGLEVKVKSYPKYSSTIYTCIPKKGYIINSLYDSQRNDTVWRKYKHDKYTVVAIVYTRKTQLIVLFVIDVNPNKSKVLYYRNLPSSGWRERYRESLDQCYLDTIIKGEWRISEKVL